MTRSAVVVLLLSVATGVLSQTPQIPNRNPCIGFECQNGGKCRSPIDRPFCECYAGFTGRFCETRQHFVIDPCSRFCLNGGTCTAPADAPICRCPKGFSGERCENATTTNPGTCPVVTRGETSVCGGVSCTTDSQCLVNQKCCTLACGGQFCTNVDIIIDPCSRFCLNGGTCTAPADAPICRCPKGFSGERCENEITTHPGSCPTLTPGASVCGGVICTSDSQCLLNQKCCTLACGGKFCTNIATRDPCATVVCQNGGTCTSPNDAQICMCPPGYTGQFCESLQPSRDPCIRPVCQNGGTCISPLDFPLCQCPDGFGGARCEKIVRLKAGTCPADPNPRETSCTSNCDGDYDCPGDQKCCNTNCARLCTGNNVTNPCSGFCFNGGYCRALPGPVCQCQTGFAGYRCHIDNRSDRPSCPLTKPGYSSVCGGLRCTSDSQCKANQRCCSLNCGGKYCTNVGVVIDPCESLCFNGGTCIPQVDTPFCQCPPGFSGTRCEIYQKVNPGSCPVPGDVSVCGDVPCTSDIQCSSDQKCCGFPCGGTFCTNDVVPQTVTPPPMSCATVRCNNVTTCRHVVECLTCPIRPKCLPLPVITTGIDDICLRNQYTEAVLLESANSTSYGQLLCGGPTSISTRVCPAVSVCVTGGKRRGVCCRGKVDPVAP